MSRRLKQTNYHSPIRRECNCPTPSLAFSPYCLLLCLGLAAIPLAASFAAGADGAVQLNAEVATAIAMKIQSPNDTNPDCIAQSGVTYGVVNRYATSNGSEGSKQVDTFDGTTGGADEVNTNTSCAKSIMTPNTYTSTYSDITVYTNSPSGYAVSLQTSQPNLVNVSDNTKNIPAGVLTESNGEVAGGQNVWSYKTDNGIVTSWTAASSTDTTIKSYDQETSGGEATRVTYGVSAGATPTGTYATNLTYTATIFDGDNPHVGQVQASETTNLSISPMSLKIARNASKTITVTPATGYYLSGVTCPADYTCSGYVTDKDDPASTAAQTITIKNIGASSTPVNISFTVTPLKTLADISTMQEMDSTIVSGSATGASKTLTDSRDNKTYTVTKLADGNIWMTQDLKLDGGRTLTSADSDVTANFNLLADNSGTWCTSDDSSCYDQSLMTKQNAPNGYLYNWYAATAGTGTYSVSSGDVSASICPKGWKLPTGGSSGQFVALDKAYGGNGTNRTDSTQKNKFFSSPLNFNYTGWRNGGSTYSTTGIADYWSRTALSSSNAYYQYFNSSGYVYPQHNDRKYNGFAIRCVAAS